MSAYKRNEASLHGILIAVIATIIARGMGFVRELLTANFFGTNEIADAFIVSVSIPDILISGFSAAVATIYIPIYFKIKSDSQENNNTISDFNSSVIAFLCIIAMIFIAIVELFPSAIVFLFASGFNEYTFKSTTYLTRITIISVLPIFLSCLYKAYAQAHNKYALITLFSSVVSIITVVGLFLYNENNIYVLGIFVVLGNIIYCIITRFIIKKDFFVTSKRVSLRNSYLRILIVSIFPILVSNVISEVNQIIDKTFASHLKPGTISALNYSSKVINLITAIIGTAISSVLFSKLSKVASEKNDKYLAKEVQKTSSLFITILLPIFFFVFIYSKEIIIALFNRGNFGVESLEITYECLLFYSLGIIGFNFKALWIRVYNASVNTKIPAINSAIAVVFNIVLNLILMPNLGHKGLALATALSSICTDILLIIQYKRINYYFSLSEFLKDVIKPLIASLIFIPILSFAHLYIGNNFFEKIVFSFIFLVAGMVIYICVLVIFKAEFGIEVRRIIHKVKNKVN